MQSYYFFLNAIEEEDPITQPADLADHTEKYADFDRLPPATTETKIRFDTRRPLLDCHHVMPYGQLCSARFLDLLKEEGVPGSSIPVTVVDGATGAALSERRRWWIPKSVRDAIDLDRCEFSDAGYLTKLVLRPEIAHGNHLFQAPGVAHYLVDGALREKLEAAGLSGIAFAPLDTAFDAGQGVLLAGLLAELASRPDDAEGWYTAALWWWFLKRNHQALEAIDRALSLQVEPAKAHVLRGRILRDLHQLAESCLAFERALALDPASPALLDYPQVLVALGRVQDAAESARRSMDVFPGVAQSYLALADTQVAVGDYPGALATIESGLHETGRFGYRDDFWQRQFGVFMLQGRYHETLELIERVLPRAVMRRVFLKGKAAALRALGRTAEAERTEAEAEQLSTFSDYDRLRGASPAAPI